MNRRRAGVGLGLGNPIGEQWSSLSYPSVLETSLCRMEKRKGESSGPGEKKENLQVPCEEKTSDIHNSCWTLLQPDEPNDHRLLESRSLTA